MSSTYPLEFITSGSGFKTNEVAGETLGDRALVYRNAAGTWSLADADAAATMPTLGITMGAIPNGNKGEILLLGFIGDNTWTWTPGGEIYASTTPGVLTQTPPAGVGDVVQIVAVAVTATIIQFGSDLGNTGIDGVTVRENTGADVGTRPRLNFIDGSAITFTAVDDAVGNEVDITVDAGFSGFTSVVRFETPNYVVRDGLSGLSVFSDTDPNLAIEAASARGGRFATLGAGETWILDAVVTLDDANVVWVSDPELTLQAKDALDDDAVLINADNVKVYHIRIDGNKANQTGGTTVSGIHIFNASHSGAYYCYVFNYDKRGYLMSSTASDLDCEFVNCVAIDCGWNGIQIGRQAHDGTDISKSRATNCYVHGSSDVGISIYSFQNIVDDCMIDVMDGTDGSGNGQVGIGFEHAGTDHCHDNIVTNCQVNDCISGVIFFDTCGENNIIKDSLIKDLSVYGIQFQGSSGPNKAVNNTVLEFAQEGIRDVVGGNYIEGNLVKNETATISGGNPGFIVIRGSNSRVFANTVVCETSEGGIAGILIDGGAEDPIVGVEAMCNRLEGFDGVGSHGLLLQNNADNNTIKLNYAINCTTAGDTAAAADAANIIADNTDRNCTNPWQDTGGASTLRTNDTI